MSQYNAITKGASTTGKDVKNASSKDGYKTRYTSFVESIAGNTNKSKLKSVVGNYTDDYHYLKVWMLLKINRKL